MHPACLDFFYIPTTEGSTPPGRTINKPDRREGFQISVRKRTPLLPKKKILYIIILYIIKYLNTTPHPEN